MAGSVVHPVLSADSDVDNP